eukprot:CAMPEP_0183721542 /NCGR_PEP_ID=MMETSP0737-20130205/13782_1 /TAXON_ID=385413 /ORGANISM="Thalassiosira miniscula, Strain CCMP1093" /LENGTH=1052 /DNA_ID=CAMNT_0025951569 /DNA_START=64 /DNA_END=3222 /DNA_ORIENTATION=-
MATSFRNRFRRRSPGPPSSGNAIGSGSRSFLSRAVSNSSSKSNSSSSRRNNVLGSPRRRQQHNKNQPPLATFDACIEACDALAATSRQQQLQHHQSSSSSSEEDENDNATVQKEVADRKKDEALVGCSVLVSPDGALLFTSSQFSNIDDDDDDNNNNKDEKDNDRYPWTKTSPLHRDAILHSEEYESAIICGNDLTPNGDYDSNGFTAQGWNHDAATLALGASRDVLKQMELFVEELATCQKEEAGNLAGAVEKLAGFRENIATSGGKRSAQHPSSSRVGPILSQGTNFSVAIEAMEEYYAKSAVATLDRWRMACSSAPQSTTHQPPSIELKEMNNQKEISQEKQMKTQNLSPTIPIESISGLLPKLQLANHNAASRTSERERALLDIRSKFSEAQSILLKQKAWAKSRWNKVADEESNIDRLYAIKKMDQHEYYENQRRQALLDDPNQVLYGVGGEAPLSDEVWEMVQGVASMEDYGHTGFSPSSSSASRKHHVEDVMHRRFETAGSVNLSLHEFQNALQNQSQPQQSQQQQQQLSNPPPPLITRADVERESEINDLRTVAMASDEAVEDAAGKLLNIMSKGDTTLRSARLAAESCLLSECNAVKSTLTSIVAMERMALEERLQRLSVLETAVEAIDVRKDIDNYIKNDKRMPGGRSRTGEEDDGGIAAALAVLNSHDHNLDGTVSSGNGNHGGSMGVESPRKYTNIERPSHFEGWGEDHDASEDDGYDEVEPELFGEVIKSLFEEDDTRSGNTKSSNDGSRPYESLSKEEKMNRASNALAEKSKQGQSSRKTILYELNNQRSKRTQVESQTTFHDLCRIFNAFLTGCGRESVDVSNAKMLMILSQTFYFVDKKKEADDVEGKKRGGGEEAGDKEKDATKEDEEADDVRRRSNATHAGTSSQNITKDRECRIYVKTQICHHAIWSDEDFWDQAVYQCVSESLSKSGVLLNYIKSSSLMLEEGESNGAMVSSSKATATTIKWHDLSPDEYAGAAAQVHSVVFAQLGTLSHSMIELGCGIPRACNFVRRLSIRYQLPLSLRITLIQHLKKNRN